MLEAVLYINVDLQRDRRQLVRQQIKAFMEATPAHARYPHVERVPSHPAAAQSIAAAGWRHAFVLEDDFVWSRPLDIVHAELEEILRMDPGYGIFQFGYRTHALTCTAPLPRLKSRSLELADVLHVSESTSASGYLLSAAGAKQLVLLFEQTLQESSEPRDFSVGAVWDRLTLPRYAVVPRWGAPHTVDTE